LSGYSKFFSFKSGTMIMFATSLAGSTALPLPAQRSIELAVIDAAVEDAHLLVDGLRGGVEYLVLEAHKNGIEQITAYLYREHLQVHTLHLIAHGAPGTLSLGNTQLSLETLDRYQGEISTWFTADAETPSLLIYGCRVAVGDAGTEFVERLHRLTGAGVAASSTPIGCQTLGGNWYLDVTAGQSEAELAFNNNVLSNYSRTLSIQTITTIPDWNGTSSISSFGEPNTATYGQTFTVPLDYVQLNSFSFLVDDFSDPGPINFVAYIMAWDGFKATGDILYQSDPYTTAGSPEFETFIFSTGGLLLEAEQKYVAFLSASTQFDGVTGRGRMAIVSSNPYSGGEFVFINNGSDFNLLTSSNWASSLSIDSAFSMEFSIPNFVSISDIVIDEDSGQATFTVTLVRGEGSVDEVVVDYATADGEAIAGLDYVATSGQLTFAPGETQKTITVDIIDDLLNEDNETFRLILSNAVNALITNGTATATIIDNDPEPNLSIGDITVNEGDGTATFTVTLDAASSKDIQVNFATQDGEAIAGEDYIATTGTLTFAPGETQQTFTVDIIDDLLNEGNETFGVTLSNAVNAGIEKDEAIATIIDNDPLPTLNFKRIKIEEGDRGTTQAEFVATLSDPSGQTVSFDYRTADGRAKASDGDYEATQGTVTFAPGETEQIITVNVFGDGVYEKNEGFFLRFNNASNAELGKRRVKGIILNDDPMPKLRVSNVSVKEGDRGKTKAEFVLTRSGDTNVRTVARYRTVDGTATAKDNDYIPKSGKVTFKPGETEKIVRVDVVGDTKVEPDEQFQLEVFRANHAEIVKGVGTATIRNDDRAPTRGQSIDPLIGNRTAAIAPKADSLTSPQSTETVSTDFIQPNFVMQSSTRLEQLSSAGMDSSGLFGSEPLFSTGLSQQDVVLAGAAPALI
jgi:hypothetical protein